MLIVHGTPGTPAGDFPTVYPSRLRAYGAAPPFDEVRGCPALYKARYVTCTCGHPRDVHEDGNCRAKLASRKLCTCSTFRSSLQQIAEHGSPLDFGGAVHAALFHMEQHATGPDEALRETWPAALGLDRWAEAVDLLDRYLERGGPMARYATLAVETELQAQLYVDDDFGPIWFAGIIDWLGVDTNLMQQLHVSDYKSNQRPLSLDEVRVDSQLRGYDWLVAQNWATTLGMPGRPSIVAHMDALRWSDIEVAYSDEQREEWQSWAIAAARSILRDTEGREIVSEGCRWCPRKLQCDAYDRLPGDSEAVLLRRSGRSPEELWDWRRRANTTVGLLKKGIEDVDEILVSTAEQSGPFIVDDQRWAEEDVTKDVRDMEALHGIVGDALFYDVVTVTKKALDQIKKARPDLASAIDNTETELVVDRKVKRSKVKSDG